MRPVIDWERLCGEYLASFDWPGSRRDFKPHREAAHGIRKPTRQDFLWLIEALKDDRKKWFVAALAKKTDHMPDRLFEPLMRAAVYERNPSLNRYLLEPCIKGFGIGRVVRYLLAVLQSGDDYEKAGASNAMYWVGGSAEDIQFRMLELFLSSKDVDVRRSLIARLELQPGRYPESRRDIVQRAIESAAGDSDAYVRHRLEIQLGRQSLYKPLPHRKPKSQDSMLVRLRRMLRLGD